MRREHAAKIGESVGPMLEYLGRLRDRMQQTGYTLDDDLLQTVLKAYDAVFTLNVRLHYQSCQGGVGGAPRSEGVPPTV